MRNMINKFKVIRSCMLSYGSLNKACIHLNKGQIWELRTYPSEGFPWYSLIRYGVSIDVIEEDFKRIFKAESEG